MKKTYQFKLNLTSNQRQTVEHWLDLLRHEYNWLLAERFNWWKFNRNDVILAPADFSVRYCSPLSAVQNKRRTNEYIYLRTKREKRGK